jgi:holo-[acyl-carrier protein] synthase
MDNPAGREGRLIFGVGIDIIEVPRIAKQLSEDERFKHRVFTEGEIAYCESKRFPAQYYAARFAAKEALLKSLGTGLRGRMTWKDIEIENDDDGKPVIHISGHVETYAAGNGVSRIHVSLSHLSEMASAVVIAEVRDRAETDGSEK